MKVTVFRDAFCPRYTIQRFSALLITLVLCLGANGRLFAETPVLQKQAFDPALWQEDFSQLLVAMSEHYANLEWAINGRHMNLAKLRKTTQIELNHTHSDAEARVILNKFVDAFGDGHLEIEWPKNAVIASQSDKGEDLCQRLGYSTVDNHPGLAFSTLPQFITVGGENASLFPGGLLTLSGQQKIGIIRIGLFAETGYPIACEQVVQRLKLAQNTRCDEDCQDTIQLDVANYLTAALSSRAKSLRKHGANGLLIDITDNGGGTNWVEAAARTFSPIPLRSSRYAFVKSEHWTRELEDRLTDVESDISNRRGPRDILNLVRLRLEQAIKQSKQRCDRRPAWRDETIHCSQLVDGLLYTSGVLPYAKPGSYTGLASRTVLFHPLRYNYTESGNRLPLYVAVDRNTWSAAEEFAEILQDNHAATIVGDITGGAGCGYTNGGIPTMLKNSKVEVKMPDCVRIRDDGTNAVNGIMPDILVPLARRDSDYQRAYKIYEALDSAR